MQLNFQKRKITIIILLCIGCVFAIFSAIIIIKVNTIRKKVERHVADINTLSRFEAETFLIINTIDKDAHVELLAKTNQLISFPDVPKDIDFSNLNRILKHMNATCDKTLVKNELVLITKSCQYAIGDNRTQLRLNSEKLLNYWNYTHILLIIASVSFLIFPLIIYRMLTLKNSNL